MKFNKFPIIALAAALFVTASSFTACTSEKPPSGTAGSSYDFNAKLTDEGYFKGIKASDYVTLPEYKGVSVPSSVFTASDTDLQQQLDGIMEKYTTYEEIKDRAVNDGDTLNIDYVGKVNGVEFEGGSTGGAGTSVTIGVTQYIDNFLEQLIGHTPGETFDINVTFPDPYQNNPDLSGKPAVFTVTINYIQGAAIEAELSDEIAADFGFANKDGLISDIKQWIISQQKVKFFNDLITNVECKSIPKVITEYVKENDIAKYKSFAAENKMDIDSVMSTYVGYESLDKYIEAQADTYKKNATTYIITQAIAEAEGLKVNDADLTEAKFDDEMIKTYGKPFLKFNLLVNKIVPNFVADNGVPASE